MAEIEEFAKFVWNEGSYLDSLCADTIMFEVEDLAFNYCCMFLVPTVPQSYETFVDIDGIFLTCCFW